MLRRQPLPQDFMQHRSRRTMMALSRAGECFLDDRIETDRSQSARAGIYSEGVVTPSRHFPALRAYSLKAQAESPFRQKYFRRGSAQSVHLLGRRARRRAALGRAPGERALAAGIFDANLGGLLTNTRVALSSRYYAEQAPLWG